MSIREISHPLAGERIVGLVPADAEAASTWLRRPNLFPGRSLTAATLEQRQAWQSAHLETRGRNWQAGVVNGLGLAVTAGFGFAATRLSLGKGQGLAVDGRNVILSRDLECLLSEVPVVAPEAYFKTGGGMGPADTPKQSGVLRLRDVGARLGQLSNDAKANLPAVGILLLQPVCVDSADIDARNPCERCSDGDINQAAIREDWRVRDAVRLLWYPWPNEWIPLPAVAAPQLRNALAWTVFDAEAALPENAVLPWEEWGVPLALMAFDANWRPLWADRASVVRPGGRARDARLQMSGRAVTAGNRLPALLQARIEQFAEQVAAAGNQATGQLADAFAAALPPVGLLPANAYTPSNRRSAFFPAGFDLDAAPVPMEQLDLALRQSAGLAPLRPGAPESVRILVPVPLQSWEPRLLLTDTVAPEFRQTLDRFLLNRSRALGVRQGLRQRQAILTRAITGRKPEVTAWNDDPAALEIESLAPWGPPPADTGHRGSIRAGVHQHYFQDANPAFTVNAANLYCWVHLDPENPPRSLMLQWRTGGNWEHRAIWGEDLLFPWGTAGTASHRLMGALPNPGDWVRLTIPAADVGLAGAAVDGMAYTLFDGRAAYGPCGLLGGSVETKWIAGLPPESAQVAGDEPWEPLTLHDLWAPCEDTLGLVSARSDTLPPTLGGHYDTLTEGTHQHFFDSAATPFTIGSADSLFCWVYLDPVDPPREIMLQWRLPNGSWEQRAFWGWNLINWGTTGENSRRRIGDLPQPGRWHRLEVPAISIGLAGASLNGMAFTQFGGIAVFGAAGACPTSTGVERVWCSASAPAGAHVTGPWNVVAGNAMRSPTEAGRTGHVQALEDLYQDAALEALSGQERAQLYLLGLEGFTQYLKARADRADDLVDYGFVKAQTDIYRVRQLMLGSTNASRLAISPALANIAQAETATASQTQITHYISTLKSGVATRDIQAPRATAPATTRAATTSKAVVQTPAYKIQYQPAVQLALQPAIYQAGIIEKAKPVADTTAIARISATSTSSATSKLQAVSAASPLLGDSFIRTTSIAERLKASPTSEARAYALASRQETVHALLRLCDAFRSEDGGSTAGLFEGIYLNGINGDEFLKGAASADAAALRRPLKDFIADRGLVAKLLTVPSRLPVDAKSGDPDEAALFSDATDLTDHVVGTMRNLEGRIKLYRDAIAACEETLAQQGSAARHLKARIASTEEELAEARHDVSVARSLLVEETERIQAVNARRATVLAEVKFLAYMRPREVDNLLATPTHAIDPGLMEAAVPACLRSRPDTPEELLDMLQVVREAPAEWFVRMPSLVQKLDKVEHLARLLDSSRQRAGNAQARPAATSGNGGKIAAAITRVNQRQKEALAPRLSAAGNFNLAALSASTWQGMQTQALKVVSFADLAEGNHGRSEVARAAATELENLRAVTTCLHAEFSALPAALRLQWAETLSEFDESPNLRNLASLPRWSEIGYIDRRQMQSYVDWLFTQIEPNQPGAVSLINDVVRMCLLLACDAPIDRIIAGRMARPVSGVAPGLRIPLTALEPARLGIGMQAVLYRGNTVVARAVVEDLDAREISARVIQVAPGHNELGGDVRIQFERSSQVSLAGAAAKRSVFKGGGR